MLFKSFIKKACPMCAGAGCAACGGTGFGRSYPLCPHCDGQGCALCRRW